MLVWFDFDCWKSFDRWVDQIQFEYDASRFRDGASQNFFFLDYQKRTNLIHNSSTINGQFLFLFLFSFTTQAQSTLNSYVQEYHTFALYSSCVFRKIMDIFKGCNVYHEYNTLNQSPSYIKLPCLYPCSSLPLKLPFVLSIDSQRLFLRTNPYLNVFSTLSPTIPN